MKYLYADIKSEVWEKTHFKTKQKIYREILYKSGFSDDTVVSLLARIIFYKDTVQLTPVSLQKKLSQIILDIKYSCYGELTVKNLRTLLTKLRKTEHRQVLISSYKNTMSRGDKGINIILSEVDFKKLDFIIKTKLLTKKTFIRECIAKEYDILKNEVKNDK